MAEKQEELTDDQRKQIKAWITSHCSGALVCPVCSMQHWSLPTHLVRTMKFLQSGGIQLGGETHPLVLLTCATCGNTLAFNAIRMGLVQRPVTQEEEEEEKEVANG